VNVFYFDGASNVQKAGAVLEVRFPRTVTYHDGKHVVALWFSSLAKIPEIKVCFIVCFIYVSLSFCRGYSNKDPFCSFSETYFKGVPLLQCRFLRREPRVVRNFWHVQPEGAQQKVTLL